jgi:hypothetical protein
MRHAPPFRTIISAHCIARMAGAEVRDSGLNDPRQAAAGWLAENAI